MIRLGLSDQTLIGGFESFISDEVVKGGGSQVFFVSLTKLVPVSPEFSVPPRHLTCSFRGIERELTLKD